MTSPGPDHTVTRALGTWIVIRVADPAVQRAALDITQRLLAEIDAACSRFRTDSELVNANAVAGQWSPASPLLVRAVHSAVEAAKHTDGLVDPTLGAALVKAGYDRTFEEVRSATGANPMELPPAKRWGCWQEIETRPDAIKVPIGAAIDLGATGKAWAADVIVSTVVARLHVPAIVSVGGDISCATPDTWPQPHPWPVVIAEDVRDLDTQDEPETILLHSGGVATSTTTLRTWKQGGAVRHHIIDPTTGSPSRGTLRTVTALGRSAVSANTSSLRCLVQSETAHSWLEARGVAARLVAVDGGVTRTSTWPTSGLMERTTR